MVDGIYVEKSGEFWVVKNSKTGEAISIGSTISAAVSSYETIMANERIAEEIGLSLEDMEI